VSPTTRFGLRSLFGINGEWEGKKEKPEQANTTFTGSAKDGKITAVLTISSIPWPGVLAGRKEALCRGWNGHADRSDLEL